MTDRDRPVLGYEQERLDELHGLTQRNVDAGRHVPLDEWWTTEPDPYPDWTVEDEIAQAEHDRDMRTMAKWGPRRRFRSLREYQE